MVDVRQCVERFVEVFNQPGSPIFALYAPQVEWVFIDSGQLAGTGVADFGSTIGRVADREMMFEALHNARGITREMQERGEFIVGPKTGAVKDSKISVHRINVSGDIGVLEGTWKGTLVGGNGNPDVNLSGHIVYVLRFNEQGLITLDHDYVLWHGAT